MARRQFKSFVILDSEESNSTSQTDSDDHTFDPGAFYGKMKFIPALFEGMQRPVKLNDKKYEKQITLANAKALRASIYNDNLQNIEDLDQVPSSN